MADENKEISKINLKGTTYGIKDATAREGLTKKQDTINAENKLDPAYIDCSEETFVFTLADNTIVSKTVYVKKAATTTTEEE